ncbi:hypothetical protein BDV26DRAFT_286707 [Aspergillus bertholletiae]|uniref:Uncharacterized protein n=1 Tax=Aspergillus bertholletiae TaxID=1226010 RepID=A0A5N7ANV8_9EURO|nr:hypothetical protein BDV26DRAFT_286707 [Aspergillus bertholletiae]
MLEHPFNPYYYPSSDCASSIYSRSTHISSDSPEINRMDHAIQTAHGFTIALETMRSRLQAAKSYKLQSRHERLAALEEELAWHQQENQFYGICYDIYCSLRTKVEDELQKLLLQSFFEPESLPSRDPFLYDVIRSLNTAVKTTQVQEVKAETDWKRFWHISNGHKVRATWI